MRIHLSCAACGYEFDAQTGPVEANGSAVREAIGYLKNSSWKNNIRIKLEEVEEIHLERALYRCRACGTIHRILQTHAGNSSEKHSPSYYCDICGKMLGKIKAPMLNSLACPHCKAVLHVEKRLEHNNGKQKLAAVFGDSERNSHWLTSWEQFEIIRLATGNRPFEECSNQSIRAHMLYDSVMKDIAKHPGAVIMCPELFDDHIIDLGLNLFEEMGLK